MQYVVVTFLWLAILLYLVLGGADFGAGIIELFTSKRNRHNTRKAAYQAIGPIWEANHMWLIIAVVILFVGYPSIYSVMSVYLHIPILMMLLGITARGTAFVFRNYDAVIDNMQKIYNRVFLYSSFITPLFLGIIAASAISGQIDPAANSYANTYVYSWLTWFSVAVGFFTVALCGFLASIYLLGEAKDADDKKRFKQKAMMMNIAAVICGAVVFIAAQKEHVPLINWVFGTTLGTIAVAAATLSLMLLWYLVAKGKTMIPRVLAGFQVTMILFALTYRHFPNFVIFKGGKHLSLLQHGAPNATMNALGWALVIGSLFILPALIYLYYSFEKGKQDFQKDQV
jgi:cytochrome d ubiquinol oxidase subunit II